MPIRFLDQAEAARLGHAQQSASNTNVDWGQIGDEIDERKEKRKADLRQAKEDERLALQAEAQQLQLAQIKQAQTEALIVPADTGIRSADDYVRDASRKLVDNQAALSAQLKNGDITTDEYADNLLK